MHNATLKDYYALTKPGIIKSNVMIAGAAFLFASGRHIDLTTLIGVLVGTSLVIASGCVFNNFLDRHIDAAMQRTQKRALVTGSVSLATALVYGTVLGVAGFAVLAVSTNLLTVLVGLVGFIDYVILYGLGKRYTPYGTLIGSISGATPPVAGYVAATNYFDGGALLLFIILTVWQMPHFYAIAMFRRDDYAAATIPVLPVRKGMHTTQLRSIAYIVVFVAAVVSLALFRYAGWSYLVVVTILSLRWLWRAVVGIRSLEPAKWAKRTFVDSLVVLTVFALVLSVNAYLP